MDYKEMMQAAEAVREVMLGEVFAAAALQGMLARPNSAPFGQEKTPEGYVKAAWTLSDLMLKERAERVMRGRA